MRYLLSLLCALALLSATPSAQSTNVQARLTATTCPGVGCVVVSTSGVGRVGLQVTGTYVGTVSFEASIDGLTYVALNLLPSNSDTAASSTTSTGAWAGNVGGYAMVRARMSAYTSGTAVVTLQVAP
jgi:hypothetical protein